MKLNDASELAHGETIRTQVLIVGTGAGGSTAAATLASAGVDVVMLEEGGYHRPESAPIDITHSIPRMWRNGGMTPVFGKPTIPFCEGRCVGGTTVVNGALMWRTPETALADWRTSTGIGDLATDQLQPFYNIIERDLSVRTADANAPGNSATRKLISGAKTLDWRTVPVARAERGCRNSNLCPTGCPAGAKQSMLTTYIPHAVRDGARVYFHCKVESILRQGNIATGIEATTPSGARIRFLADYVIVAAGPTQTPLLLRRSGLKKHVGDGLALQPNLKIAVDFGEAIDAHLGTIMTAQVKEFDDEGYSFGSSNTTPQFLAMVLAPHWAKTNGMMDRWRDLGLYIALIKAQGQGTVRKAPFGANALLRYKLHENDIRAANRAMIHMAKLFFAAGAKRIVTPFDYFPMFESPSDIARFEQTSTRPKGIKLSAVHAMSSCRMAKEGFGPSVVNEHGIVHGIKNLMIADASILPSAPGVNPQQTICSLALRNVSRLCERNGWHADLFTSRAAA